METVSADGAIDNVISAVPPVLMAHLQRLLIQPDYNPPQVPESGAKFLHKRLGRFV